MDGGSQGVLSTWNRTESCLDFLSFGLEVLNLEVAVVVAKPSLVVQLCRILL
jgi:hypothetical protein